jgi:flagellar capping protein FliD
VSMSVDGLISGMDTTSLINQLISAEAGQQTALKKRLTASETSASAYRTVNTTLAAVRAAAESVLKPESWTSTKATSSSTNVTVSAGSNATPGSMTFTVDRLASAHGVWRTDAAWTEATSAAGFASLDVLGPDGTTVAGTITVGGTQTLADAAAAINASEFGLSAAVVKTDSGTYALTVSAKKTGADNVFSLAGGGTFAVNSTGQDAKLTIGSGSTFSVTSDTNTFTGAMPGVTITVGKQSVGTDVTIDVAANPDAVATQMQTLVDAVNAALKTVRDYTSNAPGSTAALRGDYAVSQYAGQLLDGISFAVRTGTDPDTGGAISASPAQIGLQLTKDGKISFDKTKFLAAVKDNPELASRMVTGTDGPPAVQGIADRLLDITKAASDSTSGSLIKLAEGQDSIAKDLEGRIEAWDLRLVKRKEALTRQFAAMETALSSLKNQSTWLAGQINSLPTYS